MVLKKASGTDDESEDKQAKRNCATQSSNNHCQHKYFDPTATMLPGGVHGNDRSKPTEKQLPACSVYDVYRHTPSGNS